MATRVLLSRLALTTTVGRLNVPPRLLVQAAARTASTVAASTSAANHPMSQSPQVLYRTDDAKNAAFLGEADSNDGHDLYRDIHGAPHPALDPSHASFLGEADSDDGFEARKIEEGEIHEPLDTRYAAFLGEADSDDGFEARKVEEGEKQEALDAKYAAFLGEADSDDGFEADVEINPDKHDHKILDTTESDFHAEGGELR